MESNIISEIKNGSALAFKEAYDAHHQRLFFYFFRKLRSVEPCNELIQETFVKLWMYRSTLDESLPLNIQLFRIARTSFIDTLRKEARTKLKIVPLEQAADIQMEENAGNEKLSYLLNSLRLLSPMRRKIVEFRMQGLNNQEIAEHLSLSKRTVENHLNQAFHELRSHTEVSLVLLCLLTNTALTHAL